MADEPEHLAFFGTRLYDPDPEFRHAVELGFMICAVREFVHTINASTVLICLPARHGIYAMGLSEQYCLDFKTADACTHDHVHVIFTKQPQNMPDL